MQASVNSKHLALPLVLLWLTALAVGLVGLMQRLLTGHELADYTSSVPWGLWIAAYAYLVGMSVGVFLLVAVANVFGMEGIKRFTRVGLFASLVLLVSGLMMIWLDLGHMTRFYYVYTDANPSSMMAWMVWGYTTFAVLLLAALWLVLRAYLERLSSGSGLQAKVAALLTLGRRDRSPLTAAGDSRAAQALFMLGIPLVIAIVGGSGALFGVVGGRHFWNAPLMPILFIVASITSGAALLAVMAVILDPKRGSTEHRDAVQLLGRIVLGFTGVYLVLLWAEYSITLYADIPAASEPVYQVLGGPYPWVFWVFQIALGAAVPILLLTVWPRSTALVGTASLLVAGSFLFTRLNIVIPGLVEPQLEGLDLAYVDSRLSFDYFPSAMEWMVLVFIGAFATGLFFIGMRALPLLGEGEEVKP
jgi:protein NrfD